LGFALKAHDNTEIEARLEALEKAAADLTHRPGAGLN
jgi:hypothetical protein